LAAFEVITEARVPVSIDFIPNCHGEEAKSMHSKQQSCTSIFGIVSQATKTALAIVFALTVVLTQPVQAQTFTVIHTFTGQDGAQPNAGLTMDAAGNLYGTTCYGSYYGDGCGYQGCGTVFKMSKNGSGWVLSALYSFLGGSDGVYPVAGVSIGPDGSLYGTTFSGGGGGCGGQGCGTVFSLRPAATACLTALCGWKETVLYRFQGGSDGSGPFLGTVVLDQSGNIYDTTWRGGDFGGGTVYELSPSNKDWNKKNLYSFGQGEGTVPYAGVIFDESGNLYGTTSLGGAHGYGLVFQLTPSGADCVVKVLYSFQGGNDGGWPAGGVVFDQAGNLYGTAEYFGPNGNGTAYELTPSNGIWAFNLLYGFSGNALPLASVVLDAAGNVYGTTYGGGTYASGNVFKLTPADGSWTYTSLYDFTGGADGGNPYSNLIFDAQGNLYGTTSLGGASGQGVVFEITP
jgi:uncharacterized repeat protein (TIGR03803 family)